MGKIMIINASPRAPKSNSKQYAKLFSSYCNFKTEYYEVKKLNHLILCQKMKDFSDILIAFPLYADSLPVTLLNFLKTLELNKPLNRPTISVIINCGFIEPYQNNIAVEMLQLYCRNNGFTFGSVLKIGSGEAILTTPFHILLNPKMKKLAASIENKHYATMQITMPIPKRMFIRASTSYWKNYGKQNGVSKKQMQTMEIEQ